MLETCGVAADYPSWFYEEQEEGSLRSARAVVPIVLEYVSPRSVVDVGCGVGTWLSAFRERGVSEVRGLDGDYVARDRLRIPAADFAPTDLARFDGPDRRFDLAVSLEVAEHLDADRAPGFVRALTQASDVVLFSAAIPGQGGTHHVNERWPAYWAELFSREGYVAVDCLRARLWDLDGVEPWYAQNSLFYVRESALPTYPSLARAGVTRVPMALIHPRAYEALRLHRRFSLLAGAEFGYRWARRTLATAVMAIRRER